MGWSGVVEYRIELYDMKNIDTKKRREENRRGVVYYEPDSEV